MDLDTTNRLLVATFGQLCQETSCHRGFAAGTALLLAIGLLLRHVLSGRVRSRRRAAGLSDISRLAPSAFAAFIETLFRNLGYRIQITGFNPHDFGAHLIADAPDGKRTLILARRSRGAIGARAVWHALIARDRRGCDHVILLTNTVFTPQARQLARGQRLISLWDRDRLAAAVLTPEKREDRVSLVLTESVTSLEAAQNPTEDSAHAAPELARAA